MANLQTMSLEDLNKRIAALKGIGEDTVPEEAELKRRYSVPAAVPKSQAADVAYEEIPVEVQVDKASFESGGEQFESPKTADVYSGVAWGWTVPRKKENQAFFTFKTADDRIVKQMGKNILSAITITPRASGDTVSGAFKLGGLLDAMKIAYSIDDTGLVQFKVPRGKPCFLKFVEVTIRQKTEIRLDSAWVGEVSQAV